MSKSKKDFAKKIGVTRQAIEKWIAGKSHPTYQHAKNASLLLKVPMDVVLKEIITLYKQLH